MTFNDIMTDVTAATSDAELGTVKCAAKRPSMKGYAFKFTHSRNTLPALTASGAYYLSLVQNDGDQYIYEYSPAMGTYTYKGLAAKSGTALGSGAPNNTESLTLTGELIGHIGASDWTSNMQTALDAQRTATGAEW